MGERTGAGQVEEEGRKSPERQARQVRDNALLADSTWFVVSLQR